jgi:hypothetical protein
MALVSTQPLTEMSTGIFLGVKSGQRLRLTTSFSRKYGNLDVSQLYGPPWSVTGIALEVAGYLNFFSFFIRPITNLKQGPQREVATHSNGTTGVVRPTQ